MDQLRSSRFDAGRFGRSTRFDAARKRSGTAPRRYAAGAVLSREFSAQDCPELLKRDRPLDGGAAKRGGDRFRNFTQLKAAFGDRVVAFEALDPTTEVMAKPDPTGFVGDGGLELRRMDHRLKNAALEVLAWWAGPTKSDNPLYDLLAKLRTRFGPPISSRTDDRSPDETAA